MVSTVRVEGSNNDDEDLEQEYARKNMSTET